MPTDEEEEITTLASRVREVWADAHGWKRKKFCWWYLFSNPLEKNSESKSLGPLEKNQDWFWQNL